MARPVTGEGTRRNAKLRERRSCGGGGGSALPVLNQSADLAAEVRGRAEGPAGRRGEAGGGLGPGREESSGRWGGAGVRPGGRAPAPFSECLKEGTPPPRTSSSLQRRVVWQGYLRALPAPCPSVVHLVHGELR